MYWIAMLVLIGGEAFVVFHHPVAGGCVCGAALGLAYLAGIRDAQ